MCDIVGGMCSMVYVDTSQCIDISESHSSGYRDGILLWI
jgi:hypothetical protein